ncbi:hypothetical protein KKA08_05620 [bacterium]|nr:hypothetical protein [bacterium]
MQLLKSLLLVSFVIVSLGVVSSCSARIANPYPIALQRQGDIYIIRNSKEIEKLTSTGDVLELCWLDQENICFPRKFVTGLEETRDWSGFSTLYDLFLIPRDGGSIQQFTGNHFARGPSAGNMPGRAIFWRDNTPFATSSEIWETIKEVRRDRPLGISAITPDASPDQRWISGVYGLDIPEGIGLYKYPSSERYRKFDGPFSRPRFSPDSRLLAFINQEAGKTQIWGFDMPDGEPRLLLEFSEIINRVVDLGWAKDGSGYILVLEDKDLKRDVYYWELQTKQLKRLTQFEDVNFATSFH